MNDLENPGQGGPRPAERLVQDARYQGARMLRDDEVLSINRKDEVRAALRAFIDKHQIPLSKIALRLDISEPVLSQVLSGTYKANDTPWLRALDRWMGEQSVKQDAVKPKSFAMIGMAKLMFAAAKWAQKNSSIGLCYGPAGICKSFTLQAIHASIDASILVSCRTGCETPLAVIASIGRAADVECRRDTTREWTTRVEKKLSGSERLILVDEIHKLINPHRSNDSALHMLRDLHDNTGCPMLWVGTSDILTHIQTGVSRGREPLDQISSRIGPWVDLVEGTTLRDGTKPAYSLDDIKKVFQQDGMRISTDALEYLHKHANLKASGALRACVKLVQIAALAAKGGVITAELLDQALPLRSGTQVAKMRRQQMRVQDASSQRMVAAG